jgi:hypothetical protein
MYPVLAVTNATIQICNYSTSVACPSLVTTYTNSTAGTTCPTSAQLTPAISTSTPTCTATVDSEGGFGAWLPQGNYQYNVTTSYGTYGPYSLTTNGGGCNPNTIFGGCTGATTAAGANTNLINNSLISIGGQLGGIIIHDNGVAGNTGSQTPLTGGIIRSASTLDGGIYYAMNMQLSTDGTTWNADDVTRNSNLYEQGAAGNQLWVFPPTGTNPISINSSYNRGFREHYSSENYGPPAPNGIAVTALPDISILGGDPTDGYIYDHLSVANHYQTYFITASLFADTINTAEVASTNTVCDGTYATHPNFYGTSNDWCLRTTAGGGLAIDGATLTGGPATMLGFGPTDGAATFITQINLNGRAGSPIIQLLDNSGNANARNIKFGDGISNYGEFDLYFGAAGGGGYSSTPDFKIVPGTINIIGNSSTGPSPAIWFNDAASSGVNWEVVNARQTYGDLEFWQSSTSLKAAFLTPSGDFTNAGVIQAGTGYKSVDGTAGATVTTCTGFKNGLCISGT